MPRTRGVPPTTRRTRAPTIPQIEMLSRPVSIWEHLHRLSSHNYAEDTILLYEITNTGTASSNWTVPKNERNLTTYFKICELYDKTRRYAQAMSIIRSVIRSFRDQDPFTYPNIDIPVAEKDKKKKTEEVIEDEDYAWYCLYCVLQKTNKHKEAHNALMHIRGNTYRTQIEQEMPMLLQNMRNNPSTQFPVVQKWKPDQPDENSVRVCSSSLGPVISLLKKNRGDETLVERFANQFIGNDRTNVYWWLKSAEAVGKHNFYEAVACLKKMTHENPRVLTELAKLNCKIDKRTEARSQLRAAHMKDPLWIDGMDLLAFLCIGDMNKYGTLIESVATALNDNWSHRVETLVVNGFMAHQLDLHMAHCFAKRAMDVVYSDTEQYIYAVHLKAYCLKTLEVQSRGPAATVYRQELTNLLNEAVVLMPDSPDLGLLLVDTLMEDDDGHREARIHATKFLHNNPDNVHAKLLKVHVLVNGITRHAGQSHTAELFRLLDEIINEYPHILTAFCFLLSEYSRVGDDEKCQEVLKKLTAARPHFSGTKVAKMHRVQADYLLKFNDVIPAYEHLMAAMATGLTIDSNMMASYESKFAASGAVKGDYSNLAFLDDLIPEQDRQTASPPESTSTSRATVSPPAPTRSAVSPPLPPTSSATSHRDGSPPLQVIANDNDNDQESDEEASDEDEQEEEEEEAGADQ